MENTPTTLESEGPSSCPQLYSPQIARRIADLYAEGLSLHAISQKAEMPAYSTLLRWAEERSDLRAALDGVRSVRALQFEDKAIEAVEKADGKDADRLRFEGYKWGAEVNDPARYGKKVTHAGDGKNPIVFQIVTGFGEPNEFQRPPKLGADGLIERPVIDVKAEVSDVADSTRSGIERRDEKADSGNPDRDPNPPVV